MPIHKKRPPEGFTERLREAFYASGLTTNEIERKYGINHSNFSAYMSGDMAPTIINLAIICKALKVSADYLLFGGRICNT